MIALKQRLFPIFCPENSIPYQISAAKYNAAAFSSMESLSCFEWRKQIQMNGLSHQQFHSSAFQRLTWKELFTFIDICSKTAILLIIPPCTCSFCHVLHDFDFKLSMNPSLSLHLATKFYVGACSVWYMHCFAQLNTFFPMDLSLPALMKIFGDHAG